ncbi:hypothetical protein ACXYMO_17200 [Arenibacterium sp. CAU 1754]
MLSSPLNRFLVPVLAAAVLSANAGAGYAAHANPWADDGDVVQEQFHDVNQGKSVGTPGEDEMRGVMSRNAHGKLGGDVGRAGMAGSGQGGAAGAAGAGNAGGGHGGGAGNGGGARN